MALGNLKVTLELVADQFVSGARAAQKEIDGLGRSLQDPAIKQGMQDIGKGMAAVGTAISVAGLAIAAGLVKAATSAANYGDEMLAMSRKTGISGQTLAGYNLLAEQSGTSLDKLGTGLNALQKNMVTAATSTGAQSRLFGALGISLKDAEGNLRSTSDILPQIADKFKGMEDGALKSALAAGLFGRAVGPDLIAFLSEGSDGMVRAKEAAEKYGLALTDVELLTSNKFKASQAELRLAVEGLAVSIGITLVPALTSLIDKANEYIAVASQWAKANPEVTEGLAGLSLALIGSGGIVAAIGLGVGLLPSFVSGLGLLGITSVAEFGVAAGAASLLVSWIAAGILRLKELQDMSTSLSQGKFVPEGMVDVVRKVNTVSGAILNPYELGKLGYSAYQGLTNPQVEMPDFKGVKSGSSNTIAATEAEKRMAEIRKILAGMGAGGEADQAMKKAEEARKELERFNKTVADMTASLTGTVQPSEELVAVIYRLHNTGKLTSDVMLALAKDIDTLKNSNDPLIQSIVRGIPFLQISAKSYQMMAENIRLVDDATKAYRPDVLTLPVDMSMDSIGGPLGRGDIEGNQRLEELIERRKELADQWGESLGRVSDKLVDMIVDFDFSFRRLGDIAKSTVKEMATSFLDGFFKPFKDQLTGMGKDAGDWLGELAFGKTGGVGGGEGKGLFGGLLSTFGGLFGGKGDKNSPFGDPTAGVWNPHGGGGGGLLGKLGLGNAFGGVGGAATGLMGSLNPISAGLGIANGAFDLASKITGKIGSGRDSANEIVKSQNAFVNQTLAGILSDPDLSPTNKLKMVNNAWDAYQTNLGNYGASGGENAVTSNQAFATVAPLVSQIKSDLIKGGATDTTGAEGGTYNITVNITTSDEIRNVEDLIHIIKFNKGGATTEMTKAVINMEGAITAR